VLDRVSSHKPPMPPRNLAVPVFLCPVLIRSISTPIAFLRSTAFRYCRHTRKELELELIQTQATQKPTMLRAEVYAHAMRASQYRN